MLKKGCGGSAVRRTGIGWVLASLTAPKSISTSFAMEPDDIAGFNIGGLRYGQILKLATDHCKI